MVNCHQFSTTAAALGTSKYAVFAISVFEDILSSMPLKLPLSNSVSQSPPPLYAYTPIKVTSINNNEKYTVISSHIEDRVIIEIKTTKHSRYKGALVRICVSFQPIHPKLLFGW